MSQSFSKGATPWLDRMTTSKQSIKDLLAALPAGGVGGFLHAVRPDDTPFPILGPFSPGLFPLRDTPFVRRQALVDQSIDMKSTTVNIITDIRPPSWDTKTLREMIAKYSPMMREKLERQYMVKWESEDGWGSEVRDEQVPIGAYLERVRRTVGATLFECARPRPDDNADDIQCRIARALRLIWHHETVDNFYHDFELNRSSVSNQGKLADLAQQVDYRDRGYRSSPIMERMIARFREEFRFMRQGEMELRAFLQDADGDHYYDNDFYEQVVNAAFDSALRLEAHFEERLYGAQPATGTHG